MGLYTIGKMDLKNTESLDNAFYFEYPIIISTELGIFLDKLPIYCHFERSDKISVIWLLKRERWISTFFFGF